MAERLSNSPMVSYPPPSKSAQAHAERLAAVEQTSGWLPLTGPTIQRYAAGSAGKQARPEPVTVEEEPQERQLTRWEKKELRAGREAREVLAAAHTA